MTESFDRYSQASHERAGTMAEISVVTYTLTEGDNGSQVSILFSEDGVTSPKTITDQHPNFEAVVDALRSKREGYAALVQELVSISDSVSRKFRSLSSRVTTDGANIFFDGDPVHEVIEREILKRLREDTQKAVAFFKGTATDADAEDTEVGWEALVKFLELLYANPNPQSRESFYEFITRYGLTIRKDGFVIAYKGLQDDFGSINKGYGIVDGVEVNGTLYNKPGSVIRFPRKDVDSNTAVGCSRGLHAGTHAYATQWARGGKLVAVAINPMNVVSVPDDCTFQKLRVCEYEVLNEVDPLEEAIATSGANSASYWASSWDDSYQGSGGYDSAIEDLAVGDVISFDYISIDGNAQSIEDAIIVEIDKHGEYLKAYVPSKDGYRTFNFAGISNIEISGDGDDEPEDDFGPDSDGDYSSDEESGNAESGEDFFEKIADTLLNGGGFSIGDFLKDVQASGSFPKGIFPEGVLSEDVIPEGLKDLIPADIREKAKKVFEDSGVGEVFGGLGDLFGAPKGKASEEAPAEAPKPAPAPKAEQKTEHIGTGEVAVGDTISFDYTAVNGTTQHVVDAAVEVVEGEFFKAFVPAKDGYRTFIFDGVKNIEAVQAEAQPRSIHNQVATVKVGDWIDVVLDIDGSKQSIQNALVLIADGNAVTVKLANGGYRAFTANDVDSLSKR